MLAGVPAPVHAVRRFWEKPGREVAARLLGRGCFWNSFVIVGYPSTLLALVESTAPSLVTAFGALRARVGTPWEAGSAQALYGTLPSSDFSRTVLTPSAERLAVLPVVGVEWNDLGDPGRVVTVRQRLSRQAAMA